VVEGVVQRGAKARLLRDGVVIHDGVISSLRRFKDDVREVASGFECGIGFDGYNDVKDGDLIEAYVIREVART
jgi:translation initiation factor IF-2